MSNEIVDQAKRFIFTGAPGSGKTSVIHQLQTLGFEVVHEAATDIIAAEQRLRNLEPWKSFAFIEKVIALQKQRQCEAKGGLQFYDRSPFCTYALARYLGFNTSTVLLEEIDRCLKNKIYQKQILFFENLGFIEHTHARKISYEEALVFEKIHLEIYKELGFEIVFVPKAPISKRCEFILSLIS